MKTEQFLLSTKKECMINITGTIRGVVKKSKIHSGICVVYCPHTTAGITINENADPDVVADFLLGMNVAFPDRKEFLHAEGNSSAHLKSSAVGASQMLIVENADLVMGIWQGIYFCEFDGPRNRTYFVKVISDKQ